MNANIGLGSMTFKIPRRFNVELDAEDNFLSTIITPQMEQITRGLYRSRDYDKGQPTIFIKANVGLGTIRVVWIE